jgi:hypothetical protein
MLRTSLLTAGKVLVLAVVAVALSAAAEQIAPLNAALQPAPDAIQQTALMAFVVQILFAALFYAAAVQSELGGWRLYLALFCIYFGLNIVMANVEAIIFITALAPLTVADVVQLTWRGLITTAVYLAVVVLLAGRWRRSTAASPRPRGEIFNGWLLWKVALLVLIYPAIYFGFGRLVAWQFAAVREYYATTPIIYNQAVLTLLQWARGAAWVGFGLPIFLMFRPNGRAIVYATLFYGILASVVLLIPNPFMPTAVRIPHLIELGSSMLLYGLLVGVVMVGWGRGAQRTAHEVAAAG